MPDKATPLPVSHRPGSIEPMEETVSPLPPDRLYRAADIGALEFSTTTELAPPRMLVEQPRAHEAIRFGTDMTVRGFLSFIAELRGLSGAAKRKAVERVAEMCFLEPVLSQSVETLSKGYRHRTCFAQSIIHDPDVLILDEPTDGLDPNQKHEVRTLIRKMGETKAIVFSTHILEEVDAVCSRAIIIARGRVVADATPAELMRQHPTGKLEEVFRALTTDAGIADSGTKEAA